MCTFHRGFSTRCVCAFRRTGNFQFSIFAFNFNFKFCIQFSFSFGRKLIGEKRVLKKFCERSVRFLLPIFGVLHFCTERYCSETQQAGDLVPLFDVFLFVCLFVLAWTASYGVATCGANHSYASGPTPLKMLTQVNGTPRYTWPGPSTRPQRDYLVPGSEVRAGTFY